ncbi:hypothetical protein MMC22_004682, partial [Lobaria immixta]|nr:hypothetical protein [Lobaria immixta]
MAIANKAPCAYTRLNIHQVASMISSFESLWMIFEGIVRDPILGATYCVLHGLDECDEASLEVLLKEFCGS